MTKTGKNKETGLPGVGVYFSGESHTKPVSKIQEVDDMSKNNYSNNTGNNSSNKSTNKNTNSMNSYGNYSNSEKNKTNNKSAGEDTYGNKSEEDRY